MACHRQSSRKQRRCGDDGLPEEGNGGGADKMHGKVPFIAMSTGIDGAARVAASAQPCSNSVSAHARAQACSKANNGRGFAWRRRRRSLSIRCWLRCAGQGHATHMGVLAHPGYAATRGV
jgi:hypothetical protein